MLPMRSGNPPVVNGVDPIPNLVRISSPTAPPAPGVSSRASDLSTTVAAIGGRKITPTQWNAHYLIPRKEYRNRHQC